MTSETHEFPKIGVPEGYTYVGFLTHVKRPGLKLHEYVDNSTSDIAYWYRFEGRWNTYSCGKSGNGCLHYAIRNGTALLTHNMPEEEQGKEVIHDF